jgi:hypothetical protein
MKAGLLDEVPTASEATERASARLCASCVGAALCVLAIVVTFGVLVDAYPVSSVSDAPAYTQTWLWLSTAHRLDSYASANFPPPPPPSF